MNPFDQGDNDLAADYVMGLLDEAAQAAAEQRIATDAAFAGAVNAWRERLADFDATAEPVMPSAALWARIADSTRVAPVTSEVGIRGLDLWNNIRFWRAAGMAGAFAALLFAIAAGVALMLSAQSRNELAALAQRKPIYVAVLVNEATRETGAIVNAFANGRVELIPLRPIDVPAGRTLQVWTLWDRAIGPKSIGLSAQSRTLELDLKSLPATAPDQLFEITLEPEGGSPIGRPTGPILFKGNAARAL